MMKKRNTGKRNVQFLAAAALTAALVAGQVQGAAVYAGSGTIQVSSLIPDNVTVDSPVSLSEIALPKSDYGTLSWVDSSSVPSKRVQSYEVVFRPYDSADLAKIDGWDGSSDAIYSSVTVVVSSFGDDEGENEEDENSSEDRWNEEDGSEEGSDGSGEEGSDSGDNSGEEGGEEAPDAEETPAPDQDSNGEGGDDQSNSEQNKPGSGDVEGSDQENTDKGSADKDNTDNDNTNKDNSDKNSTDKDTTDETDQNTENNGNGANDKDNTTEATPTGTVTPSPSATPEVSGTPAPTTTPDATTTPEASVTPDPDTTPEATVSPQPTVTPEADKDNIFDRDDQETEKDDRLDQADKDLTEEEQAQAAADNHSCSGISVSGINLPWYVQFRATSGEGYEFTNEDQANIFKSYEFELWDTKNNTEYEIPEGEYISVTVPVKAGYDYTIEHLLDSGAMETIVPSVEGSIMVFSTHSFSPFGIAGSKPLVGGEIQENGYKDTSSATTTPKATVKPSGNTGSSSQGTAQSGTQTNTESTGQSGTSYNSDENSNSSADNGENSKSKRSVETGDNTPIAPFVVLGIAAIVIIGVILYLRSRKKK